MKTKEQQIEELKATAVIHLKVADKLQQQIEALEKPEQWGPRGGGYWVSTSGNIRNHISTPRTCNFGSERKTEEAAEKASATMRTHTRLLAYVDEFGGDWQADWEDKGQPKYCVYYHQTSCTWHVHTSKTCCISGTVYMSQDCAEGLVEKLNSGEVVL